MHVESATRAFYYRRLCHRAVPCPSNDLSTHDQIGIRLEWQAQLPHPHIVATLTISKGIVAKDVGLDCDTRSELEGAAALDVPAAAICSGSARCRIHRELALKGVTGMLLWQEYVAGPPAGGGGRTCRYTQL